VGKRSRYEEARAAKIDEMINGRCFSAGLPPLGLIDENIEI
jgi:hypothetical protein